MKYLAFFPICLLLIGQGLLAQSQIVHLNVSTSLEMGKDNLLVIQAASAQQRQMEARHTDAMDWWMPTVAAGSGIQQLNGQAMNADGSFIPGAVQSSQWVGSSLSASWDLNQGPSKARSSGLRASSSAWDSEAVKQRGLIHLAVETIDWSAATMKRSALAGQVLEMANLVEQMSLQLEAGIGTESDFLLASSQLHHLSYMLLNAESDLANHEAVLINWLQLDPSTQLLCDACELNPLLTKIFMASEARDRPELMSQQLRLQATAIEKQAATWGFLLPQAELGVYQHQFGLDLGALLPQKILQARLLWSLPLSHVVHGGQRKQAIEAMTMQQIQLKMVQAQLHADLRQSTTQWDLSAKQIQVTNLGFEEARMAWQQCLAKQDRGIAEPLELLQAQQILLQASLDQIDAVARQNKAYYQQKLAWGMTI